MVKEPGQEQGKIWSSSVSLARATATDIPGFDSRAPDVSVIGLLNLGTEGLALQQVANKVSALLWFRHDQTLDFLLCFPMWRTCPSYLKSQRAG